MIDELAMRDVSALIFISAYALSFFLGVIAGNQR